MLNKPTLRRFSQPLLIKKKSLSDAKYIPKLQEAFSSLDNIFESQSTKIVSLTQFIEKNIISDILKNEINNFNNKIKSLKE